MKASRKQNFEENLPQGYTQALYINAKDKKLGIIFNSVALVVLMLILGAVFLILHLDGKLSLDILKMDGTKLLIFYLVFFGSMVSYIILHELVHGIAYKALTGEKLTFGISWSCAFCGVPNIYTYRKTALISVISPFLAFTVLFIPLLIVLYNISTLYFLVVAFLFGMHVGGCSGDLYVTFLLLTKFKDKKALMRDTGPEQYFFIPSNNIDN